MFDMLNGHLPPNFFGRNFTYIILGHIWRDSDRIFRINPWASWKNDSAILLENPLKILPQNTQEKNADFDTANGHLPPNFFGQNFHCIIFTLITVGLNTQKWFWDHLKKWLFGGRTPYHKDNNLRNKYALGACMRLDSYQCRSALVQERKHQFKILTTVFGNFCGVLSILQLVLPFAKSA
jgi:hypothetical protein